MNKWSCCCCYLIRGCYKHQLKIMFRRIVLTSMKCRTFYSLHTLTYTHSGKSALRRTRGKQMNENERGWVEYAHWHSIHSNHACIHRPFWAFWAFAMLCELNANERSIEHIECGLLLWTVEQEEECEKGKETERENGIESGKTPAWIAFNKYYNAIHATMFNIAGLEWSNAAFIFGSKMLANVLSTSVLRTVWHAEYSRQWRGKKYTSRNGFDASSTRYVE